MQYIFSFYGFLVRNWPSLVFKERVAEGGHSVPAEDVRRRFVRSINNFFSLYEPLLDSWMLFDNSKANPVLIAKRRGDHKEVIDHNLFLVLSKNVR